MKPTVIGIRKDGQAEVYVPLKDKAQQMEQIHSQYPEAVVRQESPAFLSVAFKSVSFASKAARQLK